MKYYLIGDGGEQRCEGRKGTGREKEREKEKINTHHLEKII